MNFESNLIYKNKIIQSNLFSVNKLHEKNDVTVQLHTLQKMQHLDGREEESLVVLGGKEVSFDHYIRQRLKKKRLSHHL